MVYFIDTNIFLRVLTKDDEKTFEDCVKFLKLVRKKNIIAFTSSIVLAEIAWTLHSYYGFDRKETAKALQSVLNLKSLKMVNDFNLPISVELFTNHGVKFIDCLISSLSEVKSGKMTIISFDKDFDKLGVKRKEPKEVR